MTLDQATEFIRQTLLLALIVSAPMLLIGLVVGVVVSLLQAITQIQEQTLTFVPKIVVTFAAIAIAGPWMLQQLIAFCVPLFEEIALVGP